MTLDELEATIIDVKPEKVVEIYTEADIDDEVDICSLMCRTDYRSDEDVLREWRRGVRMREEAENGKTIIVVDEDGIPQYVRVKPDNHLGAVGE